MQFRTVKQNFLIIITLIIIANCYKFLVLTVKVQAQQTSLSTTTQVADLLKPTIANPRKIPIKPNLLQSSINPPQDGSNDYLLKDDPDYPARQITDAQGKVVDVPQGKIAYVWNAKQFLHALYGNYYSGRSGSARIPYQNAQSDQFGYDTDITKIVLEDDINLAQADQDPDIYVPDPKTNKIIQDNAHKVQFFGFGDFTGTSATAAGDCWYIYLVTRRTPSWTVDDIKAADGSTKHLDFSALTIDGQDHQGQRHWLNLSRFSITTYQPDPPRWNQKITVQNVDLYGNSFYGIVRAESLGNNTQEIYKDVNYYGAQFLYSVSGSNTSITTQGQINAYSLKTYIGPDGKTYNCQGGGNQENMQTFNIIFDEGSTYTGYTYNGPVLELTGSATLKTHSHVYLYPHGDDPQLGHAQMSMNWGISMPNNTKQPTLELQGDASLNINCDAQDAKDAGIPPGITTDKPMIDKPVGAIYMGGSNSQIIFNEITDPKTQKTYDPEINIQSDGAIDKNNPLVNLSTGKIDLSHGKLSINTHNLGNYTSAEKGGLMQVGPGMDIAVQTGGNFNISVDDNNNAADKAINLLYSTGTMNINIVNPKNVSLDLRKDNCPNSALVYTGGNGALNKLSDVLKVIGLKELTLPDGTLVSPNTQVITTSGADINVYDSKIRATGDNGAIDGSNGEAIGFPTAKTIQVGMDAAGPIRFQHLTLPFYHNLLAPILYLDGSKIIQTTHKDMDILKNAMLYMMGKEFRYIQLSDLPGPNLTAVSPTLSPDNSQIKGTVKGDEWADTNKIGNEFYPHAPLLRVQIQHQDGTMVDLGDFVNDKAASEVVVLITNLEDPAVKYVTPNLLQRNADGLDITDESHLGHMVGTVVNNKKVVNPVYEPTKKVTWSHIEQNNNHFVFNLKQAVTDYNNRPVNSSKKLHLRSTDKILTSVVTNYQASPRSITTIKNLAIEPGLSQTFLLGDQISVPLFYQDGDDFAPNNQITLKGTSTDNKGHQSPPLNGVIIPINTTGAKTAATWVISEPTKAAGQYTLNFSGQDELGNNDDGVNGKGIDWHYNVLNLPAYDGQRTLMHPDHKTTIAANDSISMGYYYDQSVFTPKNQTAAITNFSFQRVDDKQSKDKNISLKTTNLIITNKDTQKTVVINNFKYDKKYTAQALSQDSQNLAVIDKSDPNQIKFQKNIQFTLETKFFITAVPKISLAQIKLTTDYQDQSTGATNQVALGQVAALTKEKVDFLELTVPNQLNYGKKPLVPHQPQSEYSIYNRDGVQNNLILNYQPHSDNHLQVYVKYVDASGLWPNALLLKNQYQTASYLDQGDALVYDQILQTSLTDSMQHVQLAADWWNNQNIQTQGIFMETPNQSQLQPDQYQGKLEWTAVNSVP